MTDRSATRPRTLDRAALVGCVLTKNEEANIERALRSIVGVADAVLVIDSGSTDRTVELAEACGAEVVEHPFESYPAQRNWALEEIRRRWGDDAWAFTLDADEWLSDDLARELRSLAPALGDDADVYIVPLRRRFDGRVLRFGGFGRTWTARLWRCDYAAYGDREVNESLTTPESARLASLNGWLEHADVASWHTYIAKHNHYSDVEAAARIGAIAGQDRVTLSQAARDRTLRRRFLRQRIWDHLPAKPAIRFIQIYVVFGGFLDGRPGFERALFEAWQEMTVDLKARELVRS